MPKTQTDEVPLDWMKKEQDRSKTQGAGEGNLVNTAVPQPKEKKLRIKVDTPKANSEMPFLERIQKGFHPTKDRAEKFDILVATQKHASRKKGPDLIDEALDLLFEKYETK